MHQFKSDLINDMDHVCISGTEPSSVILSRRKQFYKLKMYAKKEPKQGKVKRDGQTALNTILHIDKVIIFFFFSKK